MLDMVRFVWHRGRTLSPNRTEIEMKSPNTWLEAGAHAAAFHGHDDPRAVAGDIIAAALPHILNRLADDVSGMAANRLDPEHMRLCASIRNWSPA